MALPKVPEPKYIVEISSSYSEEDFNRLFDLAETPEEKIYIAELKAVSANLKEKLEKLDEKYEDGISHINGHKQKDKEKTEQVRDQKIAEISYASEKVIGYIERVAGAAGLWFGSSQIFSKNSFWPPVITVIGTGVLHFTLGKYEKNRKNRVLKKCREEKDIIDKGYSTEMSIHELRFDMKKRNKCARAEEKLMQSYADYFGIQISETSADRYYNIERRRYAENPLKVAREISLRTQNYKNN